MAAACGSLQQIFEKPLPETESPTTLLDSLSSPWNQINNKPTTITTPINNNNNEEEEEEESSNFLTEIFGESHFKENPEQDKDQSLNMPPSSTDLPLISSSISSSSSSSFSSLSNSSSRQKRKQYNNVGGGSGSGYGSHKNSDSFSTIYSESLQLCKESLGFESSDFEAEESIKTDSMRSSDHEYNYGQNQNITNQTKNITNEEAEAGGEITRRSRSRSRWACKYNRAFPPPISSINRQSGKPWVIFKSYRYDGRFILKEIRIPTQEFLRAHRKDGRLRLQLIQSDDETLDDDDDDDDDDDEEEDEDEDHDPTDTINNANEEENDVEFVQLNSNGVGDDL